MSLLPRGFEDHPMPAHPYTQLPSHLAKRAAAGSSYGELVGELRRYRDRLKPYEYQELMLLCRSLVTHRGQAGENGKGDGNGHRLPPWDGDKAPSSLYAGWPR